MLTNIHSIKTTKISCEKENVDHLQNSSRISKFETVKEQQARVRDHFQGKQQTIVPTKSIQKHRRRGISRTLSAAKVTPSSALKRQQIPSEVKSRYTKSRAGLQVSEMRKSREVINDEKNEKIVYHTGQDHRISPMKFLLQEDEYKITVKNQRNPSVSQTLNYTQTKQNQAKQLKFGKSHNTNQLQFCYQKISYLQQQLVIIQKQKIQLENQLQYHQSQIKSLKQTNLLLQDQLQRNRTNLKISPSKKSYRSNQNQKSKSKSKSPRKGIELTQSAKKKTQGQARLLSQIEQLIGKNKHLTFLNEQRSKQISQLQTHIQTLRGKLRDSVRQQEDKLNTIVELQKDLAGYKNFKDKLSEYEGKLQRSRHAEMSLKNQLQELKMKNIGSLNISHDINSLQLTKLKRKCQFVENELQLERKKNKRMQVQLEEISNKFDKRILERQQQILKQQKIIKQLNQDIRIYVSSSIEGTNGANFNKTHGSLKQNIQVQSLVYQLMGQSPVVYKQMHQQIQMISLKKEQFRQENNILRAQLEKVLYEVQNSRRDIQQLIDERKIRDKQILDLRKQLETFRSKSVHNASNENSQIKSINQELALICTENHDLRTQNQSLRVQNQSIRLQNQECNHLINQIESKSEMQIQSLQKQIKQLEQLMHHERKKLQQENYQRLTQMETIFQRNRSVSSLQLLNKVEQLQRKNQVLNLELKELTQTYETRKISMQQQYEKIIYNFKEQILKVEQQKLTLIQYNRNLQEKQQRHLDELNFQRKEIQSHYQTIMQARRLSNSNVRRRSVSRSPPSKYVPEQQDISALRREIDYLKTQLGESKTKTKDLINKMNNHTFERQKNEEEIKESKRKIKHLGDQMMHLKIDKQKIYKEKVDLLQQVNKKQQQLMEYQNLIKSLEDKTQLYLKQLKQMAQVQYKYETQLSAKLELAAKLRNFEQVIDRFKNENNLIEERYKSFVNLNEKYKAQIVSLQNQVIKYKQLVQILKKEKNSLQIKSKTYHSQSIKPLQNVAIDRKSREKIYQKLASIKSDWFTINYRDGQSEYQFLMTLFEKTKLLCEYYRKQIGQKMDLKDKLRLHDQVCRKYEQMKSDYQQIKLDYQTVYEKYLKYKQIARLEKQRAKQGQIMVHNNRIVNDKYLEQCHKIIHDRLPII